MRTYIKLYCLDRISIDTTTNYSLIIKQQCKFGCIKINPRLRRGPVPLSGETRFDCAAGTSQEYTLPIPESVDELSYVVRSAAYPVSLKMAIKMDGIGTKIILKAKSIIAMKNVLSELTISDQPFSRKEKPKTTILGLLL